MAEGKLPVCSLVNSYVTVSEVTIAFVIFSIRIKEWRLKYFLTFDLSFLDLKNNKPANDKLRYPVAALIDHSDHGLGKRGGLHSVLAHCNFISCDV